jgi:dihydroflavonol-4-reductase
VSGAPPPTTDALRGCRVFITGATGFLGYAIARALCLQGAEVHALCRGSALPGELGAMGARIIHGDLHDERALDRGLDGADYVFHVAADLRASRSAWADVLRTNVEGTRVLVARARLAGVRRLVFTSSGSTLGKPLDATRGPIQTIDETSAYNFGALGWVYPHTKWLAEEVVLQAVHDGLDAVITHPTAIFGPWDWKHNLLPLFRAPRQAMGFFTTDGARSICDVRDVADGHVAAALRGRPGERYALAGEGLTVRELLTRIAREVDGHPPRITVPAGMMRALGRTLDALGTVRGKPALLSEEIAMQSCLRVVVSSEKAERELGYRSRPADESLRDAAAWYRSAGLLLRLDPDQPAGIRWRQPGRSAPSCW